MQLPTNPIEMSYDYREVVMWLRKCSRKHLEAKLYYSENEKELFSGMLVLVSSGRISNKEMNIDLTKGIMLSGDKLDAEKPHFQADGKNTFQEKIS